MMKRPSRSGRGLRVIEAVPLLLLHRLQCVYRVRVYITAAGRGTAGAMYTGWDKIVVLPKYYVSEQISNPLHSLFLSNLFVTLLLLHLLGETAAASGPCSLHCRITNRTTARMRTTMGDGWGGEDESCGRRWRPLCYGA